MDLSALSNVTSAAQALSNLILVTPNKNLGYQPQNPPNPDGSPSTATPPPGFLFHYEGENTATLDSDITDHFVEDNTAIQDQIALKPPMITVQGFIGELNDIAPAALAVLKTAADKLTVVSAYVPVISETALIAYNEAAFLYANAQNVSNAAVSAWSSVNGKAGASTQNKQQIAYQQFFGYWQNRTLFTIQTPWAIFQNMAIKTIRVVQDESTVTISEFDVTFKQIRFASTLTTFSVSTSTIGDFGNNRANAQNQPPVQIGPNTPASSISLSSAIG